MPNAQHDENHVPTVLVVSKDDLETPVNLAADPSTGAVIVEVDE